MKNSLILILLVISGILFFDDRQQRADLDNEKSSNAAMTQQLVNSQAALQAATQRSVYPMPAYQQPAYRQPASPTPGPWDLKGSDLDRPAY